MSLICDKAPTFLATKAAIFIIPLLLCVVLDAGLVQRVERRHYIFGKRVPRPGCNQRTVHVFLVAVLSKCAGDLIT